MENTKADHKSMQEQILQALGVMKKASADEIAMEIMEIKGVSSEEAVAELIIETKEELAKLLDQKRVKKIKPHGEKSRYVLFTEE